MTDALPPLLHSIPVARKLLGGVSHGHIYNLINRDELELIKLGASSKITDRSIRALIDRKGTGQRDQAA
ncbi:MAG: hypothetical protein Q8N31_01525 [Reyranella sp.]|nr:hypothetical protein [Reyranella sp.]